MSLNPPPFQYYVIVRVNLDFPGGSDGKASAYNAGDVGSIPGSGDPLEKEMANHSSILAWKSPWTGEPGRLWSMGSQRVGHDLATKPPMSRQSWGDTLG